jgi:hypothetical protein
LVFLWGWYVQKLYSKNPKDSNLKPLVTKCRVDTGTLHYVSLNIATQLKLEPLEQREVTTADGKNIYVVM